MLRLEASGAILYLILMNSGVVENQNRFISGKKHLMFQFQLTNLEEDPVLYLTITNSETSEQFELKLDHSQINRNSELTAIFRSSKEVYKEFTEEFQNIQVEEEPLLIRLSLQVQMGKFRTEIVKLTVQKRIEQRVIVQQSQQEEIIVDRKIYVDPAYTCDYSTIKKDFIAACSAIEDDQDAKKLCSEEDWEMGKLKNVFITISNVCLRSLRKQIAPYPKGKQKQDFYQYQPENQLIQQQNKLLHNILKKAAETAKRAPIPDLNLDIDIEVPRNLTVVLDDGRHIPLEDYLPQIDYQEHRRKAEEYDKILKQINEKKERIDALAAYELKSSQNFLQKCQNASRKKTIIRRVDKKEPTGKLDKLSLF